MKDIIIAVCALLCIGAFIMLIGTAGAIEQDTIEFVEGVKRLVKYTIVFAITGAVLIKIANEDDEKEYKWN